MPEPRLLPHEVFEKVRDLYWVLSFGGESANPFDWVFSQIQPAPVPNPATKWRRPTYEECVERQVLYDANPAQFPEMAQEASERLHPYAVRAKWQPVRPQISRFA